MYGYVRTYDNELKVKDVNRYRSYYCGLCKQIRTDYGQYYRLFLSYDVTFLFLIIDDLLTGTQICTSGCFESKKKCKCGVTCSEKGIELAAFLNTHLALCKLDDNYRDEGNLLLKPVYNYFASNEKYKMMKVMHWPLVAAIDKCLAKLHEMESSQERVSLDRLCKPFSELLGKVFYYCMEYACNGKYDDLTKINKEFSAYYKFGYYLGRSIYMMDALDDYEKDCKKKRFNPLKSIEKENERDFFFTAYMSMNMTYSKLKEAYNKITFGKNKDVIANVVEYGIPAKINGIINTHYKDLNEELMTNGKTT